MSCTLFAFMGLLVFMPFLWAFLSLICDIIQIIRKAQRLIEKTSMMLFYTLIDSAFLMDLLVSWNFYVSLFAIIG